MSIFLSSFENKIDKKGRISVPASFRQALAAETFQGVVLFRSYKNATIEGCGFSRMERLSESLDDMDQFSQEQDDLAATLFAESHPLSFDSDGRISLPKTLMEHAAIEERAVFVGRGSTFQIWNPEDFARHQQEARVRAQQNGVTLRLKPLKGVS